MKFAGQRRRTQHKSPPKPMRIGQYRKILRLEVEAQLELLWRYIQIVVRQGRGCVFINSWKVRSVKILIWFLAVRMRHSWVICRCFFSLAFSFVCLTFRRSAVYFLNFNLMGVLFCFFSRWFTVLGYIRCKVICFAVNNSSCRRYCISLFCQRWWHLRFHSSKLGILGTIGLWSIAQEPIDRH